MKALAARGGFTWEITSHPEASFSPELTWTGYVDQATRKYDLSLDWWLVLPERLDLGLRAPSAFLDLSVVGATHAVEDDPSFWENFKSFSRPFHGHLWLVFILFSVATALVYVLIEAPHQDMGLEEGAPLHHKLWQSLYTALLQFNGAGGFEPQTTPGKLLLAGYSFFILLFVAAYTANLASLLVVDASVSVCGSVEDCLQARSVRSCTKDSHHQASPGARNARPRSIRIVWSRHSSRNAPMPAGERVPLITD